MLRSAVCAATLVACGPERDEWIDPTPSDAIEDEVLLDQELDAAQAQQYGLDAVDFDKGVGFGLYRITDGRSVEALYDALSADFPEIRVEPNVLRSLLATNDPMYEAQWNLQMLDAESAWTVSTGAGVTVAVLDTGVYAYGDDAPVNLLPGADFIDNDGDPTDEHGHGTHVAGTVAQATNNGFGAAGLAPDVNVLPVRVLNENGFGSGYQIAQGIVWATDQGADVINLSLGSFNGSAAEADAVRYATDRGVVIVAATGNNSAEQILFPAAYDGVIAVGAVDATSTVTAYSNQGVGIDLVAPGGRLAADSDGDGRPDGILQETLVGPDQTEFRWHQGTSMAAPHVAATAALLLSAGADPAEVEDLMTTTAVDLDDPGWSPKSGFGRVDPVAALAALSTPVDPVPPPPPVDPNAPDPTPPPPAPAPTPGSGITDVDVDRFGSFVVMRWTTDVPATTHATFLGYGTVGENALTTDHELQLHGLDFWETYFLVMHSTDASGATMASELEVLLPFD